MDQVTLQRWKRADRVLDNLTLFVGMLMILYVGIAVFGLVSSSARHYSTFVLFVMIISCLASFKVFIGERLGKKFGEEGYEEAGAAVLMFGEEAAQRASAVANKVPVIVWIRGALSLIGSVLAIAGAAFIRMNADRLERTSPFFDSFDMAMGGVFTVGVLLLTLIHWGPTLTTIVALAIVYFFYGHYIDNPLFSHPAYEPAFVMNYIGLGVTQGFFLFAQTASDDIFFLVIYATTLFGLGMMPMIVEAGRLAGGRIKGGAAAPAIIGSGAVAAVMGTAVSNVVLCGRFTIPLMIRGGYSRAMAGAIEATASTAGQIMPPVLGLAAFLIAGFLGIAYIEVVKAAVLPGILYMTGVAIGVVVYARRYDLPRLHEPANLKLVWRLIPAFAISFVTVIVLLVNYFSPSVAGMAGIVVALVLSVFQGPLPSEAEGYENSVARGVAAGFLAVSVVDCDRAARPGISDDEPFGQAWRLADQHLAGQSDHPSDRCGGSVHRSRHRAAHAGGLPDCSTGGGPVHDSDWHRPAAGALLRILFCGVRHAVSAGCRVGTRGGKDIGLRFLGNRDALNEAGSHHFHHSVCFCIQS